MTNIYDLHDKAFALVSAYAVLKDGEHVASIKFKYPRDGSGRLWVYVHWIGVPMVRGYAGGYGYDKRTAALSSASRPLADLFNGPDYASGKPDILSAREKFLNAIAVNGGEYWDALLDRAGFDVIQVV